MRQARLALLLPTVFCLLYSPPLLFRHSAGGNRLSHCGGNRSVLTLDRTPENLVQLEFVDTIIFAEIHFGERAAPNVLGVFIAVTSIRAFRLVGTRIGLR